ncbi:MAG: rhodanese-like domain-containing protein [Pseudomonadota bacterium]|nr:rhodanese-like domain-containing protein [Pseudomonadota bacterium]
MQFLIENIFLIAIAFASGAMLLWPLVRTKVSGPALTTLQVTQLINGKNATIVDIRSPEEFAKGSLPNARNLPAEKLKQGAGVLKKDKPVIVVCANGREAGKVAAQLRASGFNDVFVLGGGLAAWREAGLPIRT